MSNLTVDEHIAQGKEALATSESNYYNNEARIRFASQATAHFAAASALLARYPGWGECGVKKGDYNGTQDYEDYGRSV